MAIVLGLAQVVLQIFLIVYVVRAVIRLRKGADPALDPDWHMRAFVSVPDLITQLLFAAGLALAVVALVAVSRRFGLVIPAHWYLLVGVVTGAVLSWRLRAPAVLVMSMLGAYAWVLTAGIQWSEKAGAAGITASVCAALLGVLLMAGGRAVSTTPRAQRFGHFAWLFGMLGVLVFLAWGSSLEGIAMMGEMDPGSPFRASVPLAILATWSVAAALVAVVWASVRGGFAPVERAATAVLWVLGLVLLIAPPTDTATGTVELFSGQAPALTPLGTAWAVAFNVILLAMLLGLVGLGYVRRENWLVNLGAVLLFVFVLFKYFDWLFTFLDRSIAFIGAGLLLLGVGAAMERGRRYVIHAIEESESDE